MEYLLIKRDTMIDIADAIRYKKKSSSPIPTLDMSAEIRSISGLPEGTFEDPFDAMVDCPMCNIWYVYSYYYIVDGEMKIKLRWRNNSTTDYEGFCLSMNKLGLVEGKQYKMSFVFDAGNVSALNSYPYGIKISSTRVPASGSATGQSYVLTPDKYFVRKTGTQDFEYTFTASATNYLIVLLADLPGNTQNWMSISDFKLEEITT